MVRYQLRLMAVIVLAYWLLGRCPPSQMSRRSRRLHGRSGLVRPSWEIRPS
jgi:hypothetical protein